jgi:hypothetical protein
VLRDGRILVADTTTYRIGVHAADGTFEEHIGRPISPVATTPDMEEKERSNRLAALDSGGLQAGSLTMGGVSFSEMLPNQTESMVFYHEVQVIERLATDRADRIWVQRSSGKPGEARSTDVITADGDYVGTLPPDGLKMPPAFGPDGLAVWIETDQFDAQRVVVARIGPARE